MNLARSHGELKDRAYVLRVDHDLSVREIARRLGTPRSTVGGWLKGVGEARLMRDCALCKTTFCAASEKRRYCSNVCRWKYNRILGPLPAGTFG